MDKELRKKIANYLTDQFIGKPENFPDDECNHEAEHILNLVEKAGYRKTIHIESPHISKEQLKPAIGKTLDGKSLNPIMREVK